MNRWLVWFVVTSALAVATPAAPASRLETKVRSLLTDAARRDSIGGPDQHRFAIADLEQAVHLVPDDPALLDALGRAYLAADYRHALEHHAGVFYESEWHLRGLGDANAMANWALVAPSDLRGTALTLQAGVKVPTGDTQAEEINSLFAVAIPHLDPEMRRHFAEIDPLLPPEVAEQLDLLDPSTRDELVRRYWSRNNPDPAADQNLALLEYRARLAHALLLLGDPWNAHWGRRTELYARYGRHVQIADPTESGHNEMPRLDWGEGAEKPTPRALASLGQNTTEGGMGVFAPLPPTAHRRDLVAALARFEGERGSRLLAQLETAGTPSESLWATCVVVDTSEHEVTRAAATLAPSPCAPDAQRTAEFAFDLPPGPYRVAFSLRDAGNGRGVLRLDRELAAPARGLGMSDVALCCGPLDAGRGSVRVHLDPQAAVAGDDPLNVYFEVYHLQAASDGGTRFEYEYDVRPAGPDRRPWWSRLPGADPSRLSYRSTQEGVGSTRRQFVHVPTGPLPEGRYRISVVVRDLLAGTKVERSTEFDKRAAASAE